ncbi:pitrilysin family protein [Erythrobacter sp. SD-21]|uniref:M16 family metallopeptidase n=1 Tax=Erythrobacter sp. SD-21 TaxID=161528 RepID=UPI000153F0A6|nr:insulinase family protein [Erythrobacter sp. SD-21]EDL48940.1 peptidase M16-like protein [Erythrobacter sp. SD-21]
MKIVKSACALAALPLLAIAAPLAAQDAAVPAVTAQQQSQTAWGNAIYDIAPDASVRYGMLDNGMRYAIMRNETPQDAVVVRFGFDVGWVDEEDDELGLAHFIEHMAFNGSTNIPEGEMIKLLEREGLAFGADTNASTGFEDTIYKLDLPRKDADLLGTALMLMRETASELTIAADAVDRERGVIQSETRTRNNFQIRRIKDYLKFIAPDTRFAARFRAEGTVENIDAAPADRLRELYARYYRPDNAALVIVGDVDVAAVEAEVRERFGDWQAPANAIERVEGGTINLTRGPAAANFVDPDVPFLVVIDRFAPYREPMSTTADFRRSLVASLGRAMVNRRLEQIANQVDAPIISGGLSGSDFFELYDQASLTLQAKEGEWQQALQVGEQEWRRAVEFGFSEAELAEQVANYTRRYRDSAQQQNTRQSAGLAGGILSTAKSGRLFVTPQTNWELFQTIAPTITTREVLEVFREDQALSPALVHVSTKAPIDGGDQAILNVLEASRAVELEAPAEAEVTAFGYDSFGTPGTVVSDIAVEDLGFRQIQFSNGVKLNLKTTDFEEGKLRYSVRIGSGLLSLPDDSIATGLFLSTSLAQGGLGKHSFDEIRRIMAGRDVASGLSVGGDRFATAGSTTMEDLELQLQLTAAYLTDPGFRDEALSRWQALLPPFLASTDATPQSVAQFEVPRVISDGNPRFGIPAQDRLEAVTLEQARALIAEQFAKAPIEIAVVGEIDEAAVIDAVAKTFGALPARSTQLGAFTEARQASFTARRDPVTLTHAGAEDQALALVYWPTTDDDDAQEEATMRLLASVMRLQLLEEIREKLGASYSPGAGSSMSDTFDGYGTFSTSVVVAPGDAEKVFATIDNIAAQLRDAPVDADLLDRARRPMLENLAQQKTQNPYWLGMLAEAQLEADRLDRYRTYETRLRNVTPEMMQEAAAQYLTADEALRIRIVHQSLAPSE